MVDTNGTTRAGSDESILGSAGEAVAIIDLKLRIQSVNDVFTKLTGYAAADAIRKTVNELIGAGLSKQHRESLQFALAKGETWQKEVVVSREDGFTYPTVLTLAPMYDAKEQVVSYVCSHRAISEPVELNRARSRFITNVSHQLRSPVANLKVYTHLLRKETSAEKAERYLSILEEQIDQLSHLVQDILEMAILDSGQAVAVWKSSSPMSIVETAVARYRSLAKAANLNLQILPLAPDLPTVTGDQRRLVQALGELIENAIVFSAPSGKVTVEVKMVEEERRRWATIAVRDTGPGISPQEQQRVFDRFYRGSLAESGHIPGTGLGLSIAQEIVHAHGGRLTLESEVEQGSTFTVWLPVA